MIISSEKTIARAPNRVIVRNISEAKDMDSNTEVRMVNARARRDRRITEKKRIVKSVTKLGNSAIKSSIQNSRTTDEKGIDGEVKAVTGSAASFKLMPKSRSRPEKKPGNKSTAKRIQPVAEDDTEYSGKEQADDTEFSGHRRKKENNSRIGKLVGAVIGQVLILAKLVISAITNILIVSIVTVVVVVICVMSAIETTTYNFIADEEEHLRDIISNVSIEVSGDINREKEAEECSKIKVKGQLADWREVIALWWTLKNNLSESEQWDNFFKSDQEDIKYIFDQFNRISYEVKDEETEKILVVSIENANLDDLKLHWGLTKNQIYYLDSLLAEDYIWDELLTSGELGTVALLEQGQPKEKYQGWNGATGTDASCEFVTWCMNQLHLFESNYILYRSDPEQLKEELKKKDMLDETVKSDGDIAFTNDGEKLTAGIVTRTESGLVYITTIGNSGFIEEKVYQESSGAIDCYAHIGSYYIEALLGAEKGWGWPVNGYYTVTSAYGERELGNTSFHHGMDIACPEGTEIRAAGDGVVEAARYNSSLGYYVVINHGNGTLTTYGHNSELLVAKGDYIKQGEVLALSGNTGFSTGPHCHFGLQIDMEYTNPASCFDLPEDFTGDAAVYIN